jgi:hypothetical protein
MDYADYFCLTCKTLFDKDAAFKWIKAQKEKEKAPKPKQEANGKKEKATPKAMTTTKSKTKSKAKAKPVTKAKPKPKTKPKKQTGSTLKSVTNSTVGAAKRVNNTRKKVEKVASKIWGY